MRGMRYLPKLSSMAALAFLTAMGALTACSSNGSTVVALTINSDDTVGMVDQIVVTVSADGHAAITQMIAPNKNPDSGVIVPSFFSRIELDGWSGKATLKVDAIGAGGAIITTATASDVELREHGAVAARVNLSTKKPPAPTPDAGAGGDAGGDASPTLEAGADDAAN
jgi:hypothetical protein